MTWKDLDHEAKAHIEEKALELIEAGVSAEEAWARARREFGNATLALEESRAVWRWAWLDELVQDIRYGIRTLARSRGFTTVALLTLALGIGANTAVYSVLRGVLLKPLPVAEPERLVNLWEEDRTNTTVRQAASYPDYADLKQGAQQQFESLAAAQPTVVTLTGEGEAERLQTARVTSNYFEALGVRPELGRIFGPGEPGIVLSHGLWQRKFGSSREAVGRVVQLDGVAGTILGVMPAEANTATVDNRDLWAALEAERGMPTREIHLFTMVGRMRPRTTVEQAQAEVTGIMKRLENEYPQANRGRGAVVVPLHEDLAGNLRPALTVLSSAVALLLLIACLNIANLLLARTTARGREMAVRISLGAARTRLARQLLTESLVLTGAAGALGLLVAYAGVRALIVLAPPEIPLIGRSALDWNAMAAAAGTALGAWLIFGLLPALRASSMAPAGALREASHTTASKGSLRLRHALVMVQIAITCVLVTTAGLMTRSFWRLQKVGLGYEPKGTVTFRLRLPETRYSRPQFRPAFDWPQGLAFLSGLKERVGAVPGVQSVAVAMTGPNRASWTTGVSVVGRPAPRPDQQEVAQIRTADSDYIEAVGARLARGRFFTPTDTGTNPPVAVVNESFAKTYFPGEDPVGQSIAALGPKQIVGVIGDIRYSGPARVSSPTVYLPAGQFAQQEETLIVRTRNDPAALVPTLRRIVREMDANVAPFDLAPIESALAAATARERFTVLLLAAFSLLALTLATVGIYGVVAYTVGRRRQEIALRLVLGAPTGEVFQRIVGGMLMRAAVGVTAGLAIALVMGRLMQPLVFETSVRDAATYATVAGILLLAALIGAAAPAARAAGLNAAAALREE